MSTYLFLSDVAALEPSLFSVFTYALLLTVLAECWLLMDKVLFERFNAGWVSVRTSRVPLAFNRDASLEYKSYFFYKFAPT